MFNPDPKPEKTEKPKVYRRIRPRSPKRQKQDREYSALRKEFLSINKKCQVKDCIRRANEVHHKKGRGVYYLDVSTWMGVCSDHHRIITDKPLWAVLNGYSQSRLANE
jgi:hypothetical protein